MSKLKKGVFKAALVVIIVLLVFTLLSKTIYNLMLPEVKKETMSKGYLNIVHTYSFEAVTGEDGRAVMKLGYEQLNALLDEGEISGVVLTLEDENKQQPVTFSAESYEYNEESDCFDTTVIIKSETDIPQGLPLNAQLVVKETSDSHVLVPLNCIYYDISGYYVFMLEETETLWGKGQVVRRVDVELLGTDYNNAAVNLNEIFTVVSSSSDSLYDGASVRVAQ